MSSYICSAKHFNSIESKLHSISAGNEIYCPYGLRDILPAWYDKRNNTQDKIWGEISSVIGTLRELNALCVTLQYKSMYEGRLDEEIRMQTEMVKEKTEVKHLSIHGLYNALRCVYYQIEVEHLKYIRDLSIEEKNALIFLDEMIKTLAFHIIRELPEDPTNNWEVQ